MCKLAKAPRLQAYLERGQGCSIFSTPRVQWQSLNVDSTNVVLIDVNQTPIQSVARDANVIAATAQRLGPADGRVLVYRYDPNDSPTPINVDHYSVLLDLASHPRIHEMVQGASTSYDDNLVRYLEQYVFWVKEEPGDDHWLTDVPSSVLTALKLQTVLI